MQVGRLARLTPMPVAVPKAGNFTARFRASVKRKRAPDQAPARLPPKAMCVFTIVSIAAHCPMDLLKA